LSGDTGVKGVVSSPDVSFDQLLRHLTHVPIVLSADIRYQRWEFFGDGQYMEVGASATLPGLLFTNANLHLKSGLAEGFLGYRLINCNKAALSLFAGARYSYMGGDLSIFDNGDARLVILRRLLGISKKLDFSGSTGWVDPVIGARGKVKIWKAISLYAEGDVGGFDANSGSAFETHRQGRTLVKTPVSSSDWSYQVQGGIEVQLTRSIWSQLGWRYLKYDYVSGGFTNKTALNGPFVQAGINF
jgi:opacity protein-like surface antigen